LDIRLEQRLTKWHEQIEKLKEAEANYFTLESSEKWYLAKLTLEAEGKSMAERETIALGSSEWNNFKLRLADAKLIYLTERRILDLKIKAYESEYQTYKLEAEAIRKHP